MSRVQILLVIHKGLFDFKLDENEHSKIMRYDARNNKIYTVGMTDRFIDSLIVFVKSGLYAYKTTETY